MVAGLESVDVIVPSALPFCSVSAAPNAGINRYAELTDSEIFKSEVTLTAVETTGLLATEVAMIVFTGESVDWTEVEGMCKLVDSPLLPALPAAVNKS